MVKIMNSESKKLDLLIIGSGPAGIYSAFLASQHKLKTIIIESSNEIGGQMLLFKDKPVYDMPGKININGKDVLESLKEQFAQTNLIININEKLLEITGSYPDFIIKTSKHTYYSKCILFTTGGGLFEPIKLSVKDEEKYNINYSIQDSNKYINKKIVIFGGGDTAIDWAHYLMKKNKVSLIHRRNRFRAKEFLLNDVIKGADIYTPYVIKEITGNKNIKKVCIENKENNTIKILECDEIFVFYGQKKIIDENNDFDIDMEKNFIHVKSNMETSKEGIFAAGNVAIYNGKIKMLVTSFGEAATAVGSVVHKVFSGKKMTYLSEKR